MVESPLLAAWREHALGPHTAVDDGAGAHRYAAIDAQARRVAVVLLDGRATLDGERVAILVSPGADFVATFIGVLLAGGCVVVLSPLHPPPETAYFCDDARVRAIVASHDLAARVAPIAEGRRVLEAHAFRDKESGAESGAGSSDGAIALPRVAADAPALQLYTSGTTGKPKGAVITHRNLATQQELLRDAWGFTSADMLLHALPLHHMHGLAIALLTALGAGARARMLPAFDATRVWDEMPSSTVFMGVPTMYQRLFVAYDAADEATRARWAEGARGLRLATSGSAALPVTLADRWRAIAGDYPVERFGMTEIGVGTTNPIAGPRKPGYVGKPLPTVETRIVEGGHDADEGELWIRGPSVFVGYFGKDDATRDAFVTDPKDAEGGAWFRTGDTVTRDADGYVRILGRTSVDILKSGGYKLSALEIEEVLREHPAVAEVAVVGVPDEAWGDRVVACVVARAGQERDCTEDALRAFARERLAVYKVPKEVVAMTELPRNPIGKVIKPELVRALEARPATTGRS